MEKWSALLVVLIFSGSAYADRIVSNLKDFSLEDMCAMTSSVRLDGEKSKEYEEKIDSMIEDMAAEFNIGISFVFNDKIKNDDICSQSSYISFEAIRNTSGNYAYFYELIIFSDVAIIKKHKEEAFTSNAVLYSNSDFGITTNLRTLKEIMDESVRKVFQEFAEDWRETH